MLWFGDNVLVVGLTLFGFVIVVLLCSFFACVAYCGEPISCCAACGLFRCAMFALLNLVVVVLVLVVGWIGLAGSCVWWFAWLWQGSMLCCWLV